MDEFAIVRSIVLRTAGRLPATAPLARGILEWAGPHLDWLLPDRAGDEEPAWDRVLAALAETRSDAARPHVLDLVDALARLLALPPVDAELLRLIVACDRLPRAGGLATLVCRYGITLPQLLGELAGASVHEADRVARRCAAVRLGLAEFITDRAGDEKGAIRWTLERLLDRAPADEAGMMEALIGRRQPAVLGIEDFAHVEQADFLVRLLRGALAEGAAGINILVHGPPGTGKTEFARTLAAEAGTALHGIGEADEDGEEPTRWERVGALSLAQRLLVGRRGAMLLFDEMEDLIGDARPSGDDWMQGRQGSKVFVNRLLEGNPVPVIWTTNAIGNVDTAIIRRMSFVLKLDLPTRRAASAMLNRVAREEQVALGAQYDALLDVAPEAATVLRVAARAGRLAGDAEGGVGAAAALVRAMRGGEMPVPQAESFDIDLFETDVAIDRVMAAMSHGASDVSFLLTGPPGTGKTAFAHHLARAIDRPLMVKRASDLISKWVGETEAQIADAFAEARRREAVLLFDEADSLLFDRTTAQNNWEVGQVNEMLTWLDHHPMPVVAATNHAARLDPAVLRRFVYEVELRPLGREAAARAFERFFGHAAPRALAEIDNLTPGDFAVVARQRRHSPERGAADLVERLRCEAAAKSSGAGRMGF